MLKKLNKEMEISVLIDTINANMEELNASTPKKFVIDKDSPDWKTDDSSNYEIDIPIPGVKVGDVFTEIETNNSGEVLTAGNGFLTYNTASGTAPNSNITVVVVKTTSIL